MEKSEVKLDIMLRNYIPESAVSYCTSLWKKIPFSFKITRKRLSRQGDYRYDPKTGIHRLTINGDLNQYSFLITYIHEYAHLMIRESHARWVAPHGREWQEAFKKLMLPLLNDSVFPNGILRPLSRHMRKPKASSSADHKLVIALMEYDDNGDLVPLDNLEEGQTFIFQKLLYEKISLRRTRVLCKQLANGKDYLIPKMVLVAPYEDNSFLAESF